MAMKVGVGTVTLDGSGKTIRVMWTEAASIPPNLGKQAGDLAIVLELLDPKDGVGLQPVTRGTLRREGLPDKRGALVLRVDGLFDFVG